MKLASVYAALGQGLTEAGAVPTLLTSVMRPVSIAMVGRYEGGGNGVVAWRVKVGQVLRKRLPGG